MFCYGSSFGKVRRHVQLYHPQLFNDLGLDYPTLLLGPRDGFWRVQEFISRKGYLQLSDDTLTALCINASRWLFLSMVFFIVMFSSVLSNFVF